MRRANAALALSALLALGGCANLCEDLGLCENTCEKLGDRICSCAGGGDATATCQQQIKNLLHDVGVYANDKSFCASRLSMCTAPNDQVVFCEWVNTECGKASCGLSYEDPADPAVCSAQ